MHTVSTLSSEQFTVPRTGRYGITEKRLGIIDDAYNYLRLRGLDGNHATQPLPSARDLPLSAENDRQDPNGLGMIPDDQPTHPSLLVWSAPDEVGLNRLTATYRYALPQITNTLQSSDKSLAYTLSERRTSFPWKSFMVSTGFDTLLNTTSTMLSKPVRSLKDPSLCYVFTGQGAQWAKMGSELEVYTTYAQSLHAADIYFQSLGSSWSLRGLCTICFKLTSATNMLFSRA